MTLRGHARIAVPVIAAVMACCTPQSAAQIPVFDPANFQQNLLSAARALDQISNQVLLLQNQALMIARMDQKLTRLGSTLSPDLQRTLTALQSQLTAGEGIALPQQLQDRLILCCRYNQMLHAGQRDCRSPAQIGLILECPGMELGAAGLQDFTLCPQVDATDAALDEGSAHGGALVPDPSHSTG